MKKQHRHELIKRMIKEEQLGTQKDIQDRLEKEGIFVTQTTLSRDMRELALTKIKRNGKLFYVLAHETSSINLLDLLSKHILRVSRAEFTLVFHTRLGEAAVLANAIDEDTDERVLGTLAGANTLLVICKDSSAAAEIEEAIHSRI
ncbi:putative Arginine repressor ArgR [Streptococcus sp. DD10]|uniref:arginine repressor n=1 Tax=Streptococcus sp. DD10 TaxID=1777878 RepID=UPI00079B9B1A|nr:arginine repressor [Streptococcus sp. DD10]KXT74337.1 putative Arginine repressor ArgR [Streptococcus sp. DD10]